MRASASTIRTLTRLAAAVAVLAPVAPGTVSAAATKTVLHSHTSYSQVEGPLSAGARLTVIQHCPQGSTLHRAETRRAGTYYDDDTLTVVNREYWPGAVVTRYRVERPLARAESRVFVSWAFCNSQVASRSTRFAGRAEVDVRLWGASRTGVVIINQVEANVHDGETDELFRTAMSASGVDSHPAGRRGALRRTQRTVGVDNHVYGVRATGRTTTTVRPDAFASMRNQYRFRTAFVPAR